MHRKPLWVSDSDPDSSFVFSDNSTKSDDSSISDETVSAFK